MPAASALLLLLPAGFVLALLASGAGALPAGWWASLQDVPGGRRRMALMLFAALAGGLLLHYLAVLLLPTWNAVWLAGLLLAAGGLLLRGRVLRASLRDGSPEGARWPLPALALLLLVLLAWTLAVPIGEWDPRSIWYFRAKLMYYAGGLAIGDGGFTLPALRFSQPDYPNLLPALGAQMAALGGVWNEYLPKLSLPIVQLAVLAGLAAAARSLLEAILLMAGIVIFHFEAFTTGYMDAYLAAFAAIAVLMLARAVFAGERAFALPGLLGCGLLPALKNEGYLLALIVMLALGAVLLLQRRPAAGRQGWRAWRSWAVMAALAFAPALCWSVLQRIWSLRGWATFNAEYGQRLLARLGNGGPELLQILDEVGRHGKVLSSLFVMAIALALLRRLPAAVLFAAGIALAYALALVLVYLGTPSEVKEHLVTSASRTALAVQAVLYAAAAVALGEAAAAPGRHAPGVQS